MRKGLSKTTTSRAILRTFTLIAACLVCSSEQRMLANTPTLPGLVSWWQGEGNGLDSFGANNATLRGGTTYRAGEVGQAFSFNGSSAYAYMPASSSLNVGAGGGFSIVAWVNPSTATGIRPIFEWNNSSGNGGIGAHFWMSTVTPGDLYANIIDTSLQNHGIASASGTITANEFQNFALTYDKASGSAVLYRNGIVVQSANLGSFTPQTSFNAYIGLRPSGSFSQIYLDAAVDETSLYSRALSCSEIQSLYNWGLANAVPEPGSGALVALGAVLIGLRRRLRP
jgi:hypothetical protein